MSNSKYMFFYSFEVLPENEKGFINHMNKFGTPIMSKYCKNWHLFKLNKSLRNNEVPQYIGFFEIPNIEEFFSSEPPEEMKATIKEAEKVCSNVKEWIAEQVASNI